ncbi:aromatic amino acid lyase [Streptomyces sp. MK37H]|nr:aromatic amino acid lyase [Streptomyces sp. MK37H]
MPQPQDISLVVLGDHDVTFEELVAVARYDADVRFSPAYMSRVGHSRMLIERFLSEERLIYGVTTGFGDNVKHVVSSADATALQENLVHSHSISVGEPLPREVVRAIMFVWLVQLGQGFSGVSLELLHTIRALLNAGVTPLAPRSGSVGYLSVEGHIARVLIGHGRATIADEVLEGSAALQRGRVEPHRLGVKEGLSLLNGTHSVTALAVLAAYDSAVASRAADLAAALTFEALGGTIKAFDARYQARRAHPEQHAAAENLLEILAGSEIMERTADAKVQDAYTLRGIPQVHGAAQRSLSDARAIVAEALKSLGDNPVIIPEGDDGVALMGANFDGTFVGLQADQTVNALTVLAKISERRTDRLVNSNLSGLPAFLASEPGLNNGFMIAQYTAASLVMEMRGLAIPASSDSVPTCAGQEDPVSNAYLATTKAYEAVQKLRYILAIEVLCAAQARDLREGLGSGSPLTTALHDFVRSVSPQLDTDRFYADEVEALARSIHDGRLDQLLTTARVARSRTQEELPEHAPA